MSRKSCYDCKNYNSGGRCVYYGATSSENNTVRDYLLYDDATGCSGYNPKADCFMTSACVDYMGLADNCAQLETLRKFRDEKLVKVNGGRDLIKEYYKVAPKIVDEINESSKKETYYKDIFNTVNKCVDCVNKNEDEKAIKLYLLMFRKYRIIFDL